MSLQEKLSAMGILDPKELIRRHKSLGLLKVNQPSWNEIEAKAEKKWRHGKRIPIKRKYTRKAKSED
jgi:hypothetical protein